MGKLREQGALADEVANIISDDTEETYDECVMRILDAVDRHRTIPPVDRVTRWEHKTTMGTWDNCDCPEPCEARARRPVMFDMCNSCGSLRRVYPPATPPAVPTMGVTLPISGAETVISQPGAPPAVPGEPPDGTPCGHGQWTCVSCNWVRGHTPQFWMVGPADPTGAEPGTGKP